MLGDLKVEEFCHAIPGGISKYLNFLMNYTLLSRNGSTRARNFFFHGWNGRHVWLIPVVKLVFYDVIVMKERL